MLLILSVSCASQDIIQLKNGKIIRGEIVSNQNGVVLLKINNKSDSIPISDIDKIFNDKKKEFAQKLTDLSFSYSSNSENLKPKEDKIEKKEPHNNYFGVENDKFAYIWASLSYERQMDKKGKFSLRLPFYIGGFTMGNTHSISKFEIRKYQSDFAYSNHNNLETLVNGLIGMAGIHFHYYPQGNFEKYFTGFYTNFGLFAYRLEYYEKFTYLIDYAGYPQYLEEVKMISSGIHKDGKHFSFGIINGYMFPSESRLYLSVAAYTGLGFNKIPYSYTRAFFHIQGMLKVGLKF